MCWCPSRAERRQGECAPRAHRPHAHVLLPPHCPACAPQSGGVTYRCAPLRQCCHLCKHQDATEQLQTTATATSLSATGRQVLQLLGFDCKRHHDTQATEEQSEWPVCNAQHTELTCICDHQLVPTNHADHGSAARVIPTMLREVWVAARISPPPIKPLEGCCQRAARGQQLTRQHSRSICCAMLAAERTVQQLRDVPRCKGGCCISCMAIKHSCQ